MDVTLKLSTNASLPFSADEPHGPPFYFETLWQGALSVGHAHKEGFSIPTQEGISSAGKIAGVIMYDDSK
jgi:hypothetical protein